MDGKTEEGAALVAADAEVPAPGPKVNREPPVFPVGARFAGAGRDPDPKVNGEAEAPPPPTPPLLLLLLLPPGAGRDPAPKLNTGALPAAPTFCVDGGTVVGAPNVKGWGAPKPPPPPPPPLPWELDGGSATTAGEMGADTAGEGNVKPPPAPPKAAEPPATGGAGVGAVPAGAPLLPPELKTKPGTTGGDEEDAPIVGLDANTIAGAGAEVPKVKPAPPAVLAAEAAGEALDRDATKRPADGTAELPE